MKYYFYITIVFLALLTGCSGTKNELDFSEADNIILFQDSNQLNLETEDASKFIEEATKYVNHNESSFKGKKDSYVLLLQIEQTYDNEFQKMSLYMNSDSTEYYLGIFVGDGNELLSEEIYSDLPTDIIELFNEIVSDVNR